MAKLDIAKARQAGFNDAQIRDYATRKGVSLYDSSTPLPIAQPEKKGFEFADLLPIIGAVGGSFVPGLGTIAGGAAGAGLGTVAKQLFKDEEFDLGEVGREAAFAGAGGLVGKGVGSVASKLLGGTAKTGSALRQGIRTPKVSPYSVGGALEEKELSSAASKLGLRGSAQAQREQSGQLYKDLYTQKSELLKGSKVTLPGETLKEQLRNQVTQATGLDLTSGANKKVFETLTAKLKGNVTEQTLDEVEIQSSKLASRTFDPKYQPVERLDIARGIYDSIDDIVVDQNPALKAIKGQVSLLKKLSPGLYASAKKPMTISPLGVQIPLPKGLIQGTADLAGRGLESAGGAAGKIPLPGNLNLERFGVGTGAGLGADSAPSSLDSENIIDGEILGEQEISQAPQDNRQEDLKKVFLSLMLANPKQASTLKSIFDFGFGDQKVSATREKGINQVNTALGIANQIEKNFKKVGETGRIAGLGQKAGAAIGFNPKATAYEALRLASIGPLARAISSEVGVLTDKDIQRAEQLLPKLTDTPEEAQLKMQLLKEAIAERRNAITSGPSEDIPLPAEFAF